MNNFCFSVYFYICQSLHVSGCYGPIIRRYNCVCATLGTCYSVWTTVWYSTLHTRQSFTQNNKYQVSHKHSCFSWWWVYSRLKHVQTDKYTKNKLWNNLALFTRLYVYILVITTSSWRRSECRPKHVGENTVNKIHKKYWSTFRWLFVYFGSDSRAEDGTH